MLDSVNADGLCPPATENGSQLRRGGAQARAVDDEPVVLRASQLDEDVSVGVLQEREGVSAAFEIGGRCGGMKRYGEVLWCGVGRKVVWVARE